METTGIILAGGKSSRMGQDKGLMLLNGKPMIEYVIESLKKVSSQIIIISNSKQYKQFGYPVYEDEIKDKGPVGGIYTGLNNSNSLTNIFVSCDTPHVSPQLLLHLLSQCSEHEVAIPVYNNKVHPLIGVYKTSVLPVFKESLNQNQLKLMLVNQLLNTNIVLINENEFDANNFKNYNSPNDF